jgi:ribonuclease R
MVHRLLQHYLDGGKSADQETYEAKCLHSSTEGLATSAERDSIKYMQVKYMDHKDQEFLGVISGVTEWGIFVEIIENKCEGMCRIRYKRRLLHSLIVSSMHWGQLKNYCIRGNLC